MQELNVADAIPSFAAHWQQVREQGGSNGTRTNPNEIRVCLSCALPACLYGKSCLLYLCEHSRGLEGFLPAKQRQALAAGIGARLQAQLRHGPATMADLAEALAEPLEALSVHLAYLVLGGHVPILPDGMAGRHVIYQLTEEVAA